MPADIPIQNIYYLLCYAWNRLDERDLISVSGIESTSIADLFARVLLSGFSRQLRRGLERTYVTRRETLSTLRGKFCLSETISRNALISGRAHCEFEELDHDIVTNQIIKTTIVRLSQTENLSTALRQELWVFVRRLHEIKTIRLTAEVFGRARLRQNIGLYGFLLDICELLFECLLVDEETGSYEFRDFVRDDKKMAGLFEQFVRNFYRRELSEFRVEQDSIQWNVVATSTGLLPTMNTDISLRSDARTIIIDTKFYRDALQTTRSGKRTIHSEHLYQLYSYLKNLEPRGGPDATAAGILLYPTTSDQLDERFEVPGHHVRVATINLNQPWQLIHAALVELPRT